MSERIRNRLQSSPVFNGLLDGLPLEIRIAFADLLETRAMCDFTHENRDRDPHATATQSNLLIDCTPWDGGRNPGLMAIVGDESVSQLLQQHIFWKPACRMEIGAAKDVRVSVGLVGPSRSRPTRCRLATHRPISDSEDVRWSGYSSHAQRKNRFFFEYASCKRSCNRLGHERRAPHWNAEPG